MLENLTCIQMRDYEILIKLVSNLNDGNPKSLGQGVKDPHVSLSFLACSCLVVFASLISRYM